MRHPESFKLSGFEFKIIYERRDREHSYYYTDLETETITILTEYSDRRIKMSLWDSIFNASSKSLYVSKFDSGKNEILGTVGRITFNFLVSNPMLLKKEVPESVNILGINYPIQLLDHIKIDYTAGGYINFNDMEIEVTERSTPNQRFNILLHEYFHEIINMVNPEKNEELTVQSLARSLNDIITNNDLSWILED